MSIYRYYSLAMAVAIATGTSAIAETGKLDVYPQEDSVVGTTVRTNGQTTPQPGVQIETQPGVQAAVGTTNGFQPTPTNPNTPRPQTPYTNGDQPKRMVSTQAERYEARRPVRDDQSRQQGQQQQGPTVHEALVKKLMKANEAEVELAKMAHDKTDNQELKQFTKALIEEHQSLSESLKELKQQDSKNREQAATVPESLCKIADQACENTLEMTKEMLSEKDGREFDMAFLGQQCVCHTAAIAELKAIQSAGPEEFQSFAEEALNNQEQHLDRIKEMIDNLQDDENENS